MPTWIDAAHLPYGPGSFDGVIIMNALHIMSEPEQALSEVERVLKPGGILFVPTFLHAEKRKAVLLSRLMSVAGFRAYHRWTRQGYHDFLQGNGFSVTESELFSASFPLDFVVAQKK